MDWVGVFAGRRFVRMWQRVDADADAGGYTSHQYPYADTGSDRIHAIARPYGYAVATS